MDLRTLSYYVAVAEELNITKAAKKLNICQPPLSYQIKTLEEELGCRLFIRNKRCLELTEAGQLLYRRAKEILNLSEKARSEIRDMGSGLTGTISLGLVEGIAPDLAAEWFAGFLKKYPLVKLRMVDAGSDELLEKLRSGIISMAVITSPYDERLVNTFPVGTEKIAAFMSKEHPLAEKEGPVRISDLVGEPLIVPGCHAVIDKYMHWFREVNSEPNIICEMNSYLDAAALSGRNVGISLFPETVSIPNDSIVSKEIEGSGRELQYFFAWRKGHPLPTIEEHFIDHVKALSLKTG